jgi:hypothetical protein
MKASDLVSIRNLESGLRQFKGKEPFDHCVIDDFFVEEIAAKLSDEFPPYEASNWFCYSNPLENKKALNDWNVFPALTYCVFSLLNSLEFISLLSRYLEIPLYSDDGLHGGGWHIHASGGNLNPHLDYSVHLKLGLQRKLNLIVYLSRELDPERDGGHLGFWNPGVNEREPGTLATEIAPVFNRAVLFDTTQKSWHGMSRPLVQPAGVYRKSLAIYYLCDPPPGIDRRGRALFAARPEQRGKTEIQEIIRQRSGVETSTKVYNLQAQADKAGGELSQA